MKTRLSAIFADPRAGYFLGTMFVYGIAGGMFGGVMNNYLHDVLHIGKVERGLVEMPRELPGLLVAALIALLHNVPELRIVRLALVSCLVGMFGLWYLGDARVAAIMMIVMWSTGEHLIMPVAPSVAMHMAREGKSGLAMGAVGSAGNMGTVIGCFVIPLLFMHGSRSSGTFASYQVTFIGAVGVLVLALLMSTRLRSHGTVVRQRMYFHRKFRRYYILELLFGARKQVFITFAPYVLVIVYGARPELMATMFGLWSVANIFLGPLLGRLIDKVSYRPVLVAEAAVLIGLCGLYGFSHRLFPQNVAFVVVCVVFFLDAVLFLTGMARSMYVKELSDSQSEVTSTLSTGVSVNHGVSIAIAALGGLVWEKLGVELLFTLAAAFSAGALFFCLSLPRRAPHQK